MDLLGATLTLAAVEDVPGIRKQIRHLAAAATADISTLDDVELLASEAVTNAVLHGTGNVNVAVTHEPGRVRVEVRDHGPSPLMEDRADHGRGLAIIDAIASRWSLLPDEYGTCLWFEVDL